MNKTISTIILISISTFCFGQKSSLEYPEKQRIALAKFINVHQEYEFIPENWFDNELLTFIRNDWGFGKNYKPYYQNNDFNNDSILDFAVILKNTKQNELVIVIFNGEKNGDYVMAHIQTEEFKTNIGLTFQNKLLNVVEFETDNVGCFISAGEYYIVEPCNF